MAPSTITTITTETLTCSPESADETISPPSSSSSTHSSSSPPSPSTFAPLTPIHHILGTLMNILILLLVAYTYSRFAIHLFLPFPLKLIPPNSSLCITPPPTTGFSNYSVCAPGGGKGLAGPGLGEESNGNKGMVLGMSHLVLTWLGAWVLTERWYGRVKRCAAFHREN
ncbi:hypothetical protein EX30DRAFT_346376 [Ascodesmis nigricans]|uniref:Uncharacterized protein n=1 Tax=Ascodesmis nigricans TaxID=341454 RepID=A0A4S2N375_9PEZI|nr:hypothetical protein EX30DRAFT_346376 [Ascodesmis nigricans]